MLFGRHEEPGGHLECLIGGSCVYVGSGQVQLQEYDVFQTVMSQCPDELRAEFEYNAPAAKLTLLGR